VSVILHFAEPDIIFKALILPHIPEGHFDLIAPSISRRSVQNLPPEHQRNDTFLSVFVQSGIRILLTAYGIKKAVQPALPIVDKLLRMSKLEVFVYATASIDLLDDVQEVLFCQFHAVSLCKSLKGSLKESLPRTDFLPAIGLVNVL